MKIVQIIMLSVLVILPFSFLSSAVNLAPFSFVVGVLAACAALVVVAAVYGELTSPRR